MRRLLTGFIIIAFAFSLIMGCTAKESSDDASKMPEATKQAEAMDTTAMDSAMKMAKDTVKAVADTTKKMMDSAAKKAGGK